jgi:integrase
VASVHRDSRNKSGVWYCYFTLADGTRVKRSTGKQSKYQAQIVCQGLQQAQDELGRGDLNRDRLAALFDETLTRLGEKPVQRINIGGWLDEWLTSKTRISVATRKGYQQAIRLFKEFLGAKGLSRPLESISETDIRTFVAELEKSGRSACTVANISRKYLSQPFERARKRGLIKFNPVIAVEGPKFDNARRDTFTPEQVSSMIAAAGQSDWAGAILFAWSTGARLSDVANLRWSSLDLEYGVASFRERKTGHENVIGLHPDFVDWIATRPVPEDPQGFVFPLLGGRRVNGSKGLTAQFDKIMDKAGIQNRLIREANDGLGRNLRALTFHSFRHPAVSQIFNASTHREIAARVSGHQTGRILDRYVHKDLETIKAATKLIPRLPRRDVEKIYTLAEAAE